MSKKIRGGSVGSMTRLKKSLKKSSRRDQIVTIKEDGLVVRFLTEPEEWFEFYEHYDDTRTGSYYFPCVEGCEYCEENPNDRPSKRYLANAVDTEEGTAIVLKLPQSAAGSLVKKYDRFQTIMDRDYSLSREGTGFDTEYDVTPESQSKFNVAKYEVADLQAVLESVLDADEDDDDDIEDDIEDDDVPVRVKKRRPAAAATKAPGGPRRVKKRK